MIYIHLIQQSESKRFFNDDNERGKEFYSKLYIQWQSQTDNLTTLCKFEIIIHFFSNIDCLHCL